MSSKIIISTFIAILVILAAYGIYWQLSKPVIAPIKPDLVVVVEEEPPLENLSEASSTPITLVSKTVVFEDGTEATFSLASEFNLVIAAEGLGKARFIAKSPDRRIFVPDMINWNLSHEGKIYILEDFDKETFTFKTRNTYLSNLTGVNSIAFYLSLHILDM